jgi:arylamine N-acetyltransferase
MNWSGRRKRNVTRQFPLTELQRALGHNYGYIAQMVIAGDPESAVRVVDHAQQQVGVITRAADGVHWLVDVAGGVRLSLPLEARGWEIADAIVDAYERRGGSRA